MKNSTFLTALTGLAFLTLIFFSQSCTKEDVNNPSQATLDIRFTDGPGAYDEVNIDVQQIEIHTDVNGWQTYPLLRAGVYNLLDFNNGIDTLLCSAVLPVGKISQMRLILGPNNTIVVNNTSYPLSTPSAMQSGLKFNVHQTLEPNKTYTLWIDFDAAKSIVVKGNGDYQLKPVIRTYTALTDGRIEGVVLPLTALATVYAVNGVDTFAAIPNPNGYFKFCGLPQANYTLLIEADPATSFISTTIPNVNVTFGAVNNVGTITLL